ncbi:MAG TPA: DUF3560 domain-containing protein [Gemmatimonadaceae bacterium]|nr:DUF3560 domain-containing protein [Gemmatimonadaceae bacterium]
MRRLTHEQVIQGIDESAERAAQRLAFEEKRAAKVERLRARAERLRKEGEARVERAHQMASIIPLGQPILVGHHSEGRDRRYRGRIETNYRKGFEAVKVADALDRRADTAEENRAISSDDPDAVEKLEARVRELEAARDFWKRVNRAVRSKHPRGALAELGLGAEKIEELLTPDFAGRTGIPAYRLTNSSGELKRLRGRIESLRMARAAEPKAKQIGEVRIAEEENRVRIYFPGKPSEEIRKLCKSSGFRWSPSAGAWQRFPGWNAWQLAERIAETFVGEPK